MSATGPQAAYDDRGNLVSSTEYARERERMLAADDERTPVDWVRREEINRYMAARAEAAWSPESRAARHEIETHPTLPPPKDFLPPPAVRGNWRRVSRDLEEYLCQQYTNAGYLMPGPLAAMLGELRALRGAD